MQADQKETEIQPHKVHEHRLSLVTIQ